MAGTRLFRSFFTGAFILVTSAWADSGALLVPGTESAAPARLTDAPGTLLASTTSFLTSSRGTFRGSLISAVYRNPSGDGLDFYFQLINAADSREAVTIQNHGGFEGWTTSVGFRTDGAALGEPFRESGLAEPTGAVRSRSGGTVGFQFTGTRLLPGMASHIVVVQTNAKFFQAGTASIIDAGVTTGNTFAPSTEEGGLVRDTGTLTITRGSNTVSFPPDLVIRDWEPKSKAAFGTLQPRNTTATTASDVSSQVKVTQTGFTRNRSTGFWITTLTVTNTSLGTIQGPIQVVLTNLTPGVTLVNASGLYNGAPYITVTNSALAPGASASVVLEFNSPANGFIRYTPVTYSGTLAAPVCTPAGGACTPNNSLACCSSACGFVNGSNLCCTLDNGPYSCFGNQN